MQSTVKYPDFRRNPTDAERAESCALGILAELPANVNVDHRIAAASAYAQLAISYRLVEMTAKAEEVRVELEALRCSGLDVAVIGS